MKSPRAFLTFRYPGICWMRALLAKLARGPVPAHRPVIFRTYHFGGLLAWGHILQFALDAIEVSAGREETYSVMFFTDVLGVRFLRILPAGRGPVFLVSKTPRGIRKHARPSPRSRRRVLLPTQMQMIGALGRNATFRIILLTLIGAPLFAGCSGARAETLSRSVERSARITLNIPSQPLADAIYAYIAATGIEALAAGAILSDRRSS